MDFSFLLRGIFTTLLGMICYYLVAVYRELKTIRKRLEKVENQLEQARRAESESADLSFPKGIIFDVQLKDVGHQKMLVVREVRAITGLGLRKTKEVVESTPVIIQKRVNHTEAENTKHRLEVLGAVVEIIQAQLV